MSIIKNNKNNEPCSIIELETIAHELRKTIIQMIYEAGSGHAGGSLSICEILAVLYYSKLKVNPVNPRDPERDRFVLSKGHAAPALYAVLARKGFFPAENLQTLRQIGSILQGHPDSRKVPGIEISSGSLGMGISFGIGVALAALLDGFSYRTYVLTGCGELDEGQNWEAFLTGAKYGLENMVVIVDYNRIQLDGSNDDILPLESIAAKLVAFNWHVIECDGHNVSELLEALAEAEQIKGKPTVIIAQTVKGKGVSFMENKHQWHGKPLDAKAYASAIAELSKKEYIQGESC